MTSSAPRSRTYVLPAVLWLAAVGLSLVRLVQVVTDGEHDFAPVVTAMIIVCFAAAAILTAVQYRRTRR